MAPKVHVVTPAERELRRKYELLRKKKEARAGLLVMRAEARSERWKAHSERNWLC